jgi:hypothetical protein
MPRPLRIALSCCFALAPIFSSGCDGGASTTAKEFRDEKSFGERGIQPAMGKNQASELTRIKKEAGPTQGGAPGAPPRR